MINTLGFIRRSNTWLKATEVACVTTISDTSVEVVMTSGRRYEFDCAAPPDWPPTDPYDAATGFMTWLLAETATP